MSHIVMSIDELIRPSRHIFLSPHYDDIAISCGGTARLLAEHGRKPIVALIFGSEPAPDYQHTAFAEQMHHDWGLDASSVIKSRRAEEAIASNVLGTTDQFLPFHDAIYRGERYLSDDDLFSRPTDDEMASLPKAIAAAVGLTGASDGDTRVYTPLGVGKHVDHQLAFATGVELAKNGWDVWCYEDLPYSVKPGAHEARITTAGVALTEAARIDVSSVWTAKIDAIMSYPSQLQTVFGRYIGAGHTREAIDGVMRDFATSIDGTHAYERFWRVK